jgi:tetratricopeptide (TPR) repeat protein
VPVSFVEAPDDAPDLPAHRPAGAPPGRAAPGPVDLADELEEADFFAQQGLLADARDALLQLRTVHAGHPVLEARLTDVDRRMAARAAPAPVPPARSTGPAAPSATDRPRSASSARDPAPPAVEPRTGRPSPTLIEPSTIHGSDFDLGADLAEELDRAPDLGGLDDEFQYSVEDVFNQFKRGVAETVTAEDSDTHYDLGIAYKEMGLVDDAVNEFETALRGNNRKKEIDSLSMIALCRMSQGRPADAVEPLRRALRSDYLTKESSKAIHYELGVALEGQGEREQALWCFQKVARAEPTYRDTANRVASLGGGPGRPPAGMATPAARPAAPPLPTAAAKPPPVVPPGRKKNIGFL